MILKGDGIHLDLVQSVMEYGVEIKTMGLGEKNKKG